MIETGYLERAIQKAQASRAAEIEAAIHRFRDCGVEIERFSIQEHPGETRLCIDDVPRFVWRLTYPDRRLGHGQ